MRRLFIQLLNEQLAQRVKEQRRRELEEIELADLNEDGGSNGGRVTRAKREEQKQ